MTLDDFIIIANIQVGLYLIGVILVLIKFKAKQPYIRLLGLFCFLPLLAHTASHILYNAGVNPNYASTIYTFVAFNLISLIYYHSFKKKYENVFILLTLLFSSFALINFFLIQKLTINSYTFILESIFVLGYVLYYFYWLMRELPTGKLQTLPMFWINSAWLLYFSGNFFLYSFTAYLVDTRSDAFIGYWTLHNILSVFVAIMIIFALWIDLQNIRKRSA